MAGQVRRRAAERLALAEAIAKGDQRPAWEVLADALHTSDVLAQRAVNAATEDNPETVVTLINASERAARMAKTSLDAGVEERRVRAYEQRIYDQAAETFTGILDRVLESLHLTPEQQATVPGIVVRELKAVADATAREEAPDGHDDAA